MGISRKCETNDPATVWPIHLLICISGVTHGSTGPIVGILPADYSPSYEPFVSLRQRDHTLQRRFLSGYTSTLLSLVFGVSLGERSHPGGSEVVFFGVFKSKLLTILR